MVHEPSEASSRATLAAVASAVAATAGVVAGTAGLPTEVAGAGAVVLGAVSAALALARSPRRRVAHAGVILAVAALALVAAANSSARVGARRQAVLSSPAVDGVRLRVCGGIVRAGERSLLVQAERVTAPGGAFSVAEPVRITRAHGRGSGERVAPHRGPAAPDEHHEALPGRRVCADGRVVAAGSGRGDNASLVPLLVADSISQAGVSSPLRAAASGVRARFSRAASAALPDRQAGLLLGMTEGDTTLLDEATLERFRATGMAHLVAVSGSNVAVVLTVVTLAVRLLVRRGRVMRALLVAPALGFFALLTALEPSVLRAVVTAGLVLAATAAGRRSDGLRAGAVSYVVLVLVSPELVGRPGFQLSYAATAGLLVWGESWSARAAVILAGRPEPGRVARAVGAAAGTTGAAQVAVAPLLAIHFGSLPVTGALANLIVVPLVPVVMLGGMAALCAASLLPAAAAAPALLRLPLDAILGVARVFADLPLSSVRVTAVAGAALGLAILAGRLRPGVVRAGALAVALVVIAGSCGAGLGSQARCGGSELRALDVGQGTAVLLRSGGRAVLFDGGPAGGGVVERLREAGIGRIDALVMSHPHADHVAGFLDVLDAMPVGMLLGPATMEWGVGKAVSAAARRTGTRVAVVEQGDDIPAGRAHAAVLWPAGGANLGAVDDDVVNAMSLAVLVRADGWTAFLPGDLDAKAQGELAASGRSLDADVLVAPHHGSSDLHEPFVDAVGPRLTLVTVGRDNRYGHPAREAMRIYGRHGPAMRTDRDGTVVVCGEAGRLRAWPVAAEGGGR